MSHRETKITDRVKLGRVDELTHRADTGDKHAAYELANIAARQGQVDEAIRMLRPHVDVGVPYIGNRIAELLVYHGRIEELTHHANAGDRYAAAKLADLLVKQDRIDEAIAILRPLADAKAGLAIHHLIDLLRTHDRLDELAAEVAAGTPGAAEALRAARSRPPH